MKKILLVAMIIHCGVFGQTFAQVKELKEVSIKTNKQLIKQDVDKLSYDIQADPENKVLSLLDMMRKVPMLSVDGEGNVLLKGEAQFRVFINGKPSSMLERNLKDVLRSMPASTIQSIEVITSPPSKYDAEGLAGIINIITVKRISDGYNGSINLNERFPAGGPVAGGTFAYKKGKFGVSGISGGSWNKVPALESSALLDTWGTNPTTLRQLSSRRTEGKNAYLNGELSYELDSLNLISGQFNVNGSRSAADRSVSSQLNNNAGLLQAYALTANDQGRGNGHDISLNYQHSFKHRKNELLTLSYRYYRSNNNSQNDAFLRDRINYNLPDYRQFNDAVSSEQTFQLDYVRPGKHILEAGLKTIMRHNESDFRYLIADLADPDRSNIFDYRQHVYAGYAAWQFNLKNWGFKAGLRLEETSIRAAQIEQDYFNLVTSASILKRFTNRSSLNLAFSQRIQRPGLNDLNPFVDRSNPNFESSGNPGLRPAQRNDIKLAYSLSKTVAVNIAVNYAFGSITGGVSVYDPVDSITRTRPENIAKIQLMGASVNLNYPVTNRLNLSLNADIRRMWADIPSGMGFTRLDGVIISTAFSSGYRLDNGLRLNASVNVRTGGVSGPQSTTNSFVNNSFSASKDLVKDKLTFSAAVNNPFSTYRIQRDEKEGINFRQISFSPNYYRSFNLSLNYRFGRLKETAVRKNARGIRNDDVGGGL